MHTSITRAFKRYNVFGFTGTPIFSINAGSGGNPNLRTTAQAFGCYWHGDPRKCPSEQHQMAIHVYTIVDAISDKTFYHSESTM
jgi:type I restriction enzyme R subunit